MIKQRRNTTKKQLRLFVKSNISSVFRLWSTEQSLHFPLPSPTNWYRPTRCFPQSWYTFLSANKIISLLLIIPFFSHLWHWNEKGYYSSPVNVLGNILLKGHSQKCSFTKPRLNLYKHKFLSDHLITLPSWKISALQKYSNSDL